MNGFFDVLINSAPFFDGIDDGGKVVIHKHHIGGIFGNVGTGFSHCAANIGFLQSGRIIDSVAGHGDDFSLRLKGFYETHFVGRRNTGIDTVAVYHIRKFSIGKLLQFRPGHNFAVVFADAKRLADGRGGQFVVPGDHNRPDTGTPAPCDGERRLFSRRIHKGGKADKDQVIVTVFMYGRRSRFWQITIPNGKHTERISGIHLQDVTEVFFLQGTKRFFSFFCQYFCTAR